MLPDLGEYFVEWKTVYNRYNGVVTVGVMQFTDGTLRYAKRGWPILEDDERFMPWYVVQDADNPESLPIGFIQVKDTREKDQ